MHNKCKWLKVFLYVSNKHAILPLDYIYIVCLHTFYAFSITSERSPNNNLPKKYIWGQWEYRFISLCETWKFYLAVGLLGPCRTCRPCSANGIMHLAHIFMMNFVICKFVVHKKFPCITWKRTFQPMKNKQTSLAAGWPNPAFYLSMELEDGRPFSLEEEVQCGEHWQDCLKEEEVDFS